MSPTLGLIEVSPELLNHIAIATIVSLSLEGLVLKHQLLNLRFEPIFAVLDILFMFEFLRLQLSSENVKLSLGLIKLVRESLIFLNFGVNVNPVSRLKILLDFHSQDVGVDWQS